VREVSLVKPNLVADEARWQAVLQRDSLADGTFYYGVRSTGIYCRPTCPSRRPKRVNVAFFDTAGAAEQAGFRPCLRCRPTEESAAEQVVAQVQALLETADPVPTLAALGQAVGLSPFHLQRLFRRATGLTPKAYAQLRRSERLKEGLKQGASVTEAMYEAGYGSARALYEKAGGDLGMTPGAYRNGGRGERIAYACRETPVGTMLVAATPRGVCALRFGEPGPMVAELQGEFPRAHLVQDAAAVEPYVAWVLAYLAGKQPAETPQFDVAATAFQQRVWAALRAIPYGQTRSYGEVAAMIGQPSAVRAVARACATNPVALMVPCHRVIRAGGDLSGYRWGVQRKQALLDRERTLAAQD
jgi:AraC family transcriptional regulator, regulatory protein of adaptative response / methylated-DNA-[protein]-cysteine methyltransferase